MFFKNFYQQHSSFNQTVTNVTLLLVILLVGTTLFAPESMQSVLDIAKSYIFEHFSWFYIMICSVFVFDIYCVE